MTDEYKSINEELRELVDRRKASQLRYQRAERRAKRKSRELLAALADLEALIEKLRDAPTEGNSE